MKNGLSKRVAKAAERATSVTAASPEGSMKRLITVSLFSLLLSGHAQK